MTSAINTMFIMAWVIPCLLVIFGIGTTLMIIEFIDWLYDKLFDELFDDDELR